MNLSVPRRQNKSLLQSAGLGSKKTTRSFVIKAGEWHPVTLQVKVKKGGKSDGFSLILIDGKQATEVQGVEFRGVDGPKTAISQFLLAPSSEATPSSIPRQTK
jgi:hypothetical protein